MTMVLLILFKNNMPLARQVAYPGFSPCDNWLFFKLKTTLIRNQLVAERHYKKTQELKTFKGRF